MSATLKRTLVLAAVVLALYGLYFAQKNVASRGPALPGNPLAALATEQVDALRVQQGAKIVELARKGADWRMVAPEDRADLARISAFLGDLKNAPVRRVVSTGGANELQAFGLDDATALRVTPAQGGASPQSVRLAPIPEGEGSYLHLEGSDLILEISQSFRGVSAEPDVWRERNVFSAGIMGITEIELRGRASFILRKNGEEYSLLKNGISTPVPAPKAAAYLATIANLRATGFLDPAKADYAKLGIDKPVLSILVRAEGLPEIEAKIGTKTDTGDLALKTNQRKIAFTVSALDVKGIEEPDL